MKPATPASFARLSGFLLAVVTALPGQSLPPVPASVPREAEPTVELSPFLVEESQDAGYAARDSLAGMRLKTPLADIASQVSVFTPELMADLALTGPDQVFMYSTNVDTTREGYTPEGGDNGATVGATFLNAGNRSRGIATLGMMRDFFPTSFSTDTYNSTRITIASGPNAMLFGLGSPAGMTDTSTKRAEFRSTYSFGGTYTRFEGYRLETDLNRVLVPRKLALRVAALRGNDRTFRPGTSDFNERLFGTATYRPFGTTTVRVSIEGIDRTASLASMVLTRDYLTPWWDSGRRGFDSRGLTPTTPAAQVNNALASQGLQGVLIPFTGRLTYVYGGTGAFQDGFFNLVNTARTNGASLQAGVPTQDSTPAWSLRRPDIVDPNFNAFGTATAVEHKGTIRNAFLEQQLRPDLILELAFSLENFRERRGSFFRPDVMNIEADANLYLPDGTANPDFRRLLVQTDTYGGITYNRNGNARAMMVYSPDFSRASGWRRHLGRYNFGAMCERWDSQSRSQNLRLSTLDHASTYTTAARNNAIDPNRILSTRYYLSPGDTYRPVAPRFGDALNFAEPVALKLPNGEQMTYRLWTQDGGFGPPTGSRQRTVSQLATGQGYFLQERVLVYGGYRNDAVKRSQSLTPESSARKPWPQVNGTVAATGLYPRVEDTRYVDWDFRETGESFNWGAIVRPLSWFQVHCSDSENFGVQTNANIWMSPYGEAIPGSRGQGRDYGFSIRWPDNKLMLRVNRWSNNQTNGAVTNAVLGLRDAPLRIENRLLEIAPGAPKQGIDLERYSSTSYFVTSMLEARGLDVELVANPTDSWRAMLNLGKQEARTQLDDNWWRWVEERLPVWQRAGSGWETQSIGVGDPTPIRQIYQQWLAAYRDPLMAVDGRVTDNQRKWRANAVVSHDFKTGRLKDWTLGGGGRYRSAPSIGYPLKTLPSGQSVADLNRPYQGDDELYFDVFARHVIRRVPLLGQRARARIQLNIRNLFDAGGITLLETKSDGRPKIYRYQLPREMILSCTVTL